MLTVNKKRYGVCGEDLTCKLMESICVDEELALRYTTYGIQVLAADGEIVVEVRDISTDKPYVQEFIHLCETHKVYSTHIIDILDDYLL